MQRYQLQVLIMITIILFGSPDTPTGTPPGAELTPSTDSEALPSFFDSKLTIMPCLE